MTTLRQAYLVAPTEDNSGAPFKQMHGDLYDLIVDAFGGFTLWPAYGICTLRSGKLKGDTVVVYAIAMEPSLENANKLRAIAQYVRAAAGQESVFIVLAGGTVDFVTEDLAS